MALIDSEGFGMSTTWADYLSYGAFQYLPGALIGTAAINTGGAYGDNYANAHNLNSTPVRAMAAAAATFYFGARTRIRQPSTSTVIGYFLSDASFVNQIAIIILPDGTIQAKTAVGRTGSGERYNGAGTLLGATAPLVMPFDSWEYLEVFGVIDASAGAVTVRLNGATVLTLTSVNTRGSAGSTMQRIGFQGGGAGDNAAMDTMHWYLCDATGSAPWNTFLGDVRVQTLFPTADDAVQFTPNGLGSNYLNAAKVPPVPFTDFNASATVGNQDSFVMQDIDGSTTTIYGVHVKPLMYKNDAGSRSGASVLISGGTTAVGSTTVLSEGGAQLHTMYQTNPDTAGAWTAAAVNAHKAGYKVAA
jgi:hypothetical protein